MWASIRGRLNKLWYVHIKQYSAAIKMNEEALIFKIIFLNGKIRFSIVLEYATFCVKRGDK